MPPRFAFRHASAFYDAARCRCRYASAMPLRYAYFMLTPPPFLSTPQLRRRRRCFSMIIFPPFDFAMPLMPLLMLPLVTLIRHYFLSITPRFLQIFAGASPLILLMLLFFAAYASYYFSLVAPVVYIMRFCSAFRQDCCCYDTIRFAIFCMLIFYESFSFRHTRLPPYALIC